MSERNNFIELDDGRMIRVRVDGPHVTIWAYKTTISRLNPRPSWVIAGDANIDDYEPPPKKLHRHASAGVCDCLLEEDK